MKYITVLLMISVTWVGLHVVRRLWRYGAHTFRLSRKPVSWTLTGVLEDPQNLDARDPILDALRRVPNEVRKPVWTPTRLLLFPRSEVSVRRARVEPKKASPSVLGGETEGRRDAATETASCWEVWEEFGVDRTKQAKPMHEPTFQKFLQRQSDSRLLSDAFQNVQFTVGTIEAGSVTKFLTGLVDWWHAGEPSFSASARLIDSADAKNDTKSKVVVLRISASGPAVGKASTRSPGPRK